MDCFVTDPHNNVLYNERKKQYDSFSHTTTRGGVYQVCFSNEFSTFSHKIVYLDLRQGDEKPLMAGMTSSTALTQVRRGPAGFCPDTRPISLLPTRLCFPSLCFQLESSCVSIHEILKVVAESQTWYRLREAHDRLKAEHLLERVTYWSVGETCLLFLIGVGQVALLRSFFTEKKGSAAVST